MSDEVETRLAFAKETAIKAGELGMRYFADIGDLVIEHKGVQDLVSNADKEVELFIRRAIADKFPADAIVGEEHENTIGTSGYTWVIDPIDGTANFVTGIPAWCVILACVHDDQTKVAAIFEPSNNELFWSKLGGGAYLNDKPIKVANTAGLNDGNFGFGLSSRIAPDVVVRFIGLLAERGGLFFRNASGGLMLCYVAAGRLIGYAEPYMNAWDCLAGQLLVSEAGGHIEQQSADDMLVNGGRVLATSPVIFDEVVAMADEAY